jgi:hypothetical protein
LTPCEEVRVVDPGRPENWTEPQYGVPPGGYTAGSPSPYPYPPVRQTNGHAIAAMVCGIIGMTACAIVGIVGIVLGNRARREIAQSGEQGDGMALAGIVLGWISVGLTLLVIVIYAVIIAVAAGNGGFN